MSDKILFPAILVLVMGALLLLVVALRAFAEAPAPKEDQTYKDCLSNVHKICGQRARTIFDYEPCIHVEIEMCKAKYYK